MVYSDIELLKGKVVTQIEGGVDDEIMVFHLLDGGKVKFWHFQDCCESVAINDIVGDLADLIGSPLLIAEKATNSDENPVDYEVSYQDSFTWTYYKFATIKGYVDVRWLGESNGYYGEEVSIDFIA